MWLHSTEKPFFGRKLMLTRLLQGLGSGLPASFVVVGARLTGKSALLHQLVTQLRQSNPAETGLQWPHPILVDCALTPTLAAFWSTLATAIPPTTPTAATSVPDPRRHFLHWLGSDRTHPPVLLLDNIDQLLTLAPSTELVSDLLQLASTLSLVLTTRKPLYDVHSRLAGAPLFGSSAQLFLGLLESDAALAWLADHQQPQPVDQALTEALLELTGGHPFLLHKVGDCLAEMSTLLPPGEAIGVRHLPFLRLRLAEHGRSLFLAQANLLHEPPAALQSTQPLIERLRRGPLSPDQLAGELLPALNWLINQAMVTYRAAEGEFAYTLYSPLFWEFLAHATTPVTPSTEPARPAAAIEPAVYENLTKIEAALLRYFQQHSRDLLSTEQLLAHVWKRPDASDRRVQEAIRRLRLQLDQQQPPIGEIKNERGRGYRFIPTANGW